MDTVVKIVNDSENTKQTVSEIDVDTTTIQSALSKLNIKDSINELLSLSEKPTKSSSVNEEDKEKLLSSLEITCEKLETLTLRGDDKEDSNKSESQITEHEVAPELKPKENSSDESEKEITTKADSETIDIEPVKNEITELQDLHVTEKSGIDRTTKGGEKSDGTNDAGVNEEKKEVSDGTDVIKLTVKAQSETGEDSKGGVEEESGLKAESENAENSDGAQKGRGPINGVPTAFDGELDGDFVPIFHDFVSEPVQQGPIMMTVINGPREPVEMQPVIGGKRRLNQPLAAVKFTREHGEPEENECSLDSVTDFILENETISTQVPLQEAPASQTKSSPILENCLRGTLGGSAPVTQSDCVYGGSQMGPINNAAFTQPCPYPGQQMYPVGSNLLNDVDSSCNVMTLLNDPLESPPHFPPCPYPQAPIAPPSGVVSPPYENRFPGDPYLSPPHSEPYPASNQSTSSCHISQSSNGSQAEQSPMYYHNATSPESDVFETHIPQDPTQTIPSPTSSHYSSQIMSPGSDNTDLEPPDLGIITEFLEDEAEKQKQEDELKLVESVLRDHVKVDRTEEGNTGMPRNESFPQLEPSLILRPGEIDQYTEQASVFDTPQSSPSDVRSSVESRENPESPASVSSAAQDSDDSKASASSMSSEEVKKLLKSKILKNKPNSSSDEKESGGQKTKQQPKRGRPFKPTTGEKTKNTKVDPNLQAEKLRKYRPIEPHPAGHLNNIQPTLFLKSTYVPEFKLNEVHMKDPAMAAQNAKQKQEQSKASRKVADIPVRKLREIDSDGDTYLHCICYEEWIEQLVEALLSKGESESDSDGDDKRGPMRMRWRIGRIFVRGFKFYKLPYISAIRASRQLDMAWKRAFSGKRTVFCGVIAACRRKQASASAFSVRKKEAATLAKD